LLSYDNENTKNNQRDFVVEKRTPIIVVADDDDRLFLKKVFEAQRRDYRSSRRGW